MFKAVYTWFDSVAYVRRSYLLTLFAMVFIVGGLTF